MQDFASADLNGSAPAGRKYKRNGTAAHTAATLLRVGRDWYPPNHYPRKPAKAHRALTARLCAIHKMHDRRRKIARNDLYI